MKKLSSKLIKSRHLLYHKMNVNTCRLKSNFFKVNNDPCCDSVFKTNKQGIFSFKFMSTFALTFLISSFCVVYANDSSRERASNCPNCRANDSKALAILNLQVKILDALGYHDGPPKNFSKEKRTFLPLISKFIEMYKPELRDNGQHMRHHPNDVDDQPQIQMQEELSQGEPCLQCMRFDEVHIPTIFKLENSTGKTENCKGVSLMLYINNSEHCQEPVKISVHQLVYSSGKKEYQQIKATEKEPDSMSWIYLDVGNELQNHVLNPSYTNNITFVIDLSYKTTSPDCPDLSKDMAFSAVLKFQYDEKIKRRSKRTPVRQDCREQQNYTDCCRYPLTIDFDEMEWDFIITPRRYESYYCSGECPFMYKHSLPHTQLVQQMNKHSGCCSPKKMSSITMLYFTTRGTILFGKVAGMVAETCGCS